MLDKNQSAKTASTKSQSADLQIGLSTQTALVNDIGLSDLEAVRLILSGNSLSTGIEQTFELLMKSIDF